MIWLYVLGAALLVAELLLLAFLAGHAAGLRSNRDGSGPGSR